MRSLTGDLPPSKAPNELPLLPSSSAWDSVSIYSMAKWRDYLFYSGSDGSTPSKELSVGILELGSLESGWRYPNNPVLDRADVGMSGAAQGISVFDVVEIDGTLYMFGSQFNDDFDIFVAEADPSDPYTWSNYTIVFSTYYRNHSPFVMVDPDDSTTLLMFFAHYDTSPYEVGLLTAPRSDPYSWTEHTSRVLSLDPNFAVYPDVRYSASEGVYRMLVTVDDSPTGTFRTVELATTDRTNWPTDRNSIIEPTGSAGDFDEDYAAVARAYGDHVFYAGRPAGSNYYQGIGVKTPSNLGQKQP